MERSARLIWNGKVKKPSLENERVAREYSKIYPNPIMSNSLFTTATSVCCNPVGRMVKGDNLELLLSLNKTKQKIDLIYIDPPFLSEKNYSSRVTVSKATEPGLLKRDVFKDRWGKGIESYLDMLYPRLKIMKSLLAESGSIFIHLDWHVSHYVKVLCDEIFCPENFINEIVWCYGGGGSTKRYFRRKHDIILWYAKTDQYIFNSQYQPYSPGTIQRGLTRVKGPKYQLNKKGAIMQDWWIDINKILSPTAHENLKYPTQKPLALLRRIIATASKPDSLVADFFAGSGTVGQVCEELNRNWLLCDNNSIAIQTSIYRLLKNQSRPFWLEVPKNLPGEGRLVIKKPKVQKTSQEYNLVNLGIEYFSPKYGKDLNTGKFSSYISFWEIDWDYNEQQFNSCLQIISVFIIAYLVHYQNRVTTVIVYRLK
jgi:site-specific DNA-methyltransferase (adenine-specific)